MIPHLQRRRHLNARNALATAVLAASAATSLGANLTWDSSGTNPTHAADGSGSWNTTAGNTKWSNGIVDALWDNASTAVFGNANGAAGTVIIDDPSGSVTAAGLIFNAPGSGSYTIAALGSNTLNLSGANPSLLVNTGVTANISAPIGGGFNGAASPGSGNASGMGLFINGGGNLILSGSSTYSGDLTVSYNQTTRTATSVTLGNGTSVGSSSGNMFIGYANDTVNGTTDSSSLILGTAAPATATLTAGTITINYNWSQKTLSTTVGSSLIVNGNDTINADNIILDAGRGNGNTKGGLATLRLGAGAVLTLNGANGTGNNVNLLDLADYNYETGGTTSTGCNANADFSLGTVNGTINTINIATGKANGSGAATGGNSVASMSFANGNLTANLIQIARRGSQGAIGTLNLVAGGAGVLTANSIVMGPSGNATGTNSTNATLNINGAKLLMTGDITNGATPSAANSAVINLGGGILDLGSHNIGSSGNPITLNATSGTLQNVNHINDTAGVTISGTGVLTLAGTNAYTGATTVNSGTIFANGANAMGAGGPLVVNNGTVDLAGFSQSVASIAGNNANGLITSSVAGTAIVTVTNGSGTYAGAIINGGAGKIVGLSVTGGSTTFTTGTHTYTGNTTVGAGASLAIGNINSTTSVINNGTFAASGSVGAITLDNGAHLTSGPVISSGTTGALSGSNLTINSGGGNLDFLANTLASFDQLSLNGSAVLNEPLNVNVTLPSTAQPGTYVLVNAASGLTLNGNTVTPSVTVAGGGTTRLSGSISETGSQVVLQVMGGTANLTWTGAADATTWDVTNHANWTSAAAAGNPNQFYQADSVTFANNTNNLTINITDAVQPTSVTFNNDAAHNYVINGNGIGGNGNLTVGGSGVVTLNNQNTYTGSTNVNSGNLIISGSGVIGGSTLNVAGGASLNLQSGGQINSSAINISGIFNVDGTVGGSTMTLTSPANVTVTSNGRINTTTLTVNGGSLTVQSGGNLASTAVSLANGASLTVQSGGNLPVAPNLTNNGIVVIGSDQTINTLNGTDATAVVTQSGNLTVSAGGSFAGSIQDGTSPGGITAAGNTLTLTGSSSFTGNININSGATLQLDNGANTGTISSTPMINVSGTFIYSRSDSPSFSNTLSSNGAFRQLGGGVVTLTGNNSGFSGAIQTYNGTIVQGGANAFGSGGGLVIGTPNGTTGNVTGTIVFSSSVPTSSVSSISSTSGSTANVLNIPAGVTLTDSGPATVGSTSGNNVLTTLSATGGGAFVINGNVTIGQGGGTGTLDLSGLNSATINDSTVNIGGSSNGGFLVLANTAASATPPSNTISTNTLNMASTASANQPGLVSQIILGAGANAIQADTINLGDVRGAAAIVFPAGAPPTASLTITDHGGGGAAAMNVSTESGNGPATPGTSGLFLEGHQANVHLSSINMATTSSNQGNIRVQSAITFDTGTFTVDGAIVMSRISGGVTTNGATASITLGGSTPNTTATGVFTSGGITMGQFTNTDATTVANATAVANLTINGGTANINGSITNASTRGSTTSTINLNSGTLNMNGNSIGGNGDASSGNGPITFNLPAAGNTATLANLGGGGINGAGLTMNAAGTLVLAGNSSYSGTTNAQSGNLITLGDSARSAIFNNTANITGGKLIFDYSGATDTDPALQVGTILAAGYAQSPKFSSGTLFTTNAPDATKGLGWFDNTAAKQLTVRYTWYGDANVDGKVNALDFNALATNFGTNAGSQIWGNGDFNYDGNVNTLDFTALATNFNQALPAPSSSLGTLVPEPSILSGLLAVGLLIRRRRVQN